METVRIADYPQLRLIAWSRRGDDLIDENEALAIYESHWQHVACDQLTTKEQAFIDGLVARYGNGILHV